MGTFALYFSLVPLPVPNAVSVSVSGQTGMSVIQIWTFIHFEYQPSGECFLGEAVLKALSLSKCRAANVG